MILIITMVRQLLIKSNSISNILYHVLFNNYIMQHIITLNNGLI